MRVFLTGASGFVGSNFARVFDARGAELVRPGRDDVDLVDARAVARAVAAAAPDAIVHAAIWNDPAGLRRDRRRAWEAYVGATRNVVVAANAAAAHVVLVSTDWVFDGASPPAPAAEDEPPRPVNTYGFLKAASELVVTERAERGTVARIAGVQGVHWARPATPRAQDAGFGYLAASIVDALRARREFTVWRSARINGVATPTLASDAADLIWRALQRGCTGVLHCCGGEHADRETLARATVEAFDLDGDLLRFGPPDDAAVGSEPIPYDTRLDAPATAAALGVALPDLRTQLRRLRAQIDTGRIELEETITA
ncbi:MAG TPA: sugar nucleotide-binding protein [Solirubrobacteraceae bacterium]|nr:sugar nucleotide-binding protein [Solirubrobacteraceae bacterium]